MNYLAFFRGINVGKNRIKMDQLQKMFENLGFISVKTYIQSGNVLFKTEMQPNQIEEILEQKFVENFGFSSSVVLRTKDELDSILTNLPFTKEDIERAEDSCMGECLYVTLLKEIPTIEKIESWKHYKSEIDEFEIIDNNIYFLFQTTIRDSKLANQVHKLSNHATTRNWNTMKKMFELAKEMDV